MEKEEKRNSKKMRIRYLTAFLLFTGIEVLIALYVHDAFIRPYVGDMLVVAVLYCAVRVMIPAGLKQLPLWIFIFAGLVEALQYFRLVEILGLQAYPFWRILLGATFDLKDIGCYAVGCVLLGVYEGIFLQA